MLEAMDILTAHGRVHIYKKGGGSKTLLLLHGSGSDSAMLSFREVLEAFDEEYTVYAPDLLGYGQSDDCEDICGEQFYQLHMETLRELTQQLNLQHFGLAGLSMGGAIAIGYALRYPEQVQYLIPVGSWGLSRRLPFHGFSYWYIHKTDLTIKQYRWCAASKALAKWSIAYSLIGKRQHISETLVKEVMDSCKGDRAGRSMQDFQRSSAGKKQAIPYYGTQLAELTMPVAFIIGERDPLVPLRDVQAAQQMLPQSELHVFEGCKHWTVKEEPERFCRIVRALEERTEGSGT